MEKEELKNIINRFFKIDGVSVKAIDYVTDASEDVLRVLVSYLIAKVED
jgi:hypothetical protein